MTKLSDKRSGEDVTVTVDFALLTTSPTSPEFFVRRLRGVADANPSAMITSAAFVNGTLASCLISGGVPGTTYAIEVWVESGPQRFCEQLEMTVTA